MLSSVDDDILGKMDDLVKGPEAVEQASRAVEAAILGGKKIYVYGCGATGRLAKQTESAFWRPFWRRVKADDKIWKKVGNRIPAGKAIEESLIGEMTGARSGSHQLARRFRRPSAHREAPASRPGHPEGRRRHLRHRGRRDVIGHRDRVGGARRVAERAGIRSCREPQESLFRLQQPRRPAAAVRQEPKRAPRAGRTTKINLTTGPQAVTGSTRMPGDDDRDLRHRGDRRNSRGAGVADGAPAEGDGPPRVQGRGHRGADGKGDGSRGEARRVRRRPGRRAGGPAGARGPHGHRGRGVRGRAFLDLLCRKWPDHGLHQRRRRPDLPALPAGHGQGAQGKCWIQVWTKAANPGEAWRAFLGPSSGASIRICPDSRSKTEVSDPYLRRAALESLKKAGNDQAEPLRFLIIQS